MIALLINFHLEFIRGYRFWYHHLAVSTKIRTVSVRCLGIRTIQIKIVQTNWTVRTPNSPKSSYWANSAFAPSKQSEQFLSERWILGMIHTLILVAICCDCLQHEVYYWYYIIWEIDYRLVLILSISILWYRLTTLETLWCDRSAIAYVTTEAMAPWSNDFISNLFK